MFVQDFIRVDRAFEEVAPRFVRDPGWMEPLMAEAIDAAVEVLDADAPAATSVHCVRGAARRRGDTLVVTTRWTVTGPPFPPLDADLAIAPLGPAATHLGLEGSYPSGAVSVNDETVVHRIVELGTRGFLQALAVVLHR